MTLYDKYGGAEFVRKCVNYFYEELVLKDESVNFFFNDTDMEKQKTMQSSFISFAIGGPIEYKGRDMKEAHKGMGVESQHFDTIVNHLGATLLKFGFSKEDLDIVVAKLSPLKSLIVQAN